MRVLTAVGLVIVCCAVGIVQGIALRIFVCIAACAGMWEMYGTLRAKGLKPAAWVGMVYAAALVPTYLWAGEWMLLPLIIFCCFAGFADAIFRSEPDLERVVYTLFPILYPGSLLAVILQMQDLPVPLYARVAFLQTLLIASMSDTFAWFVGTRFGKRRFAPKISPHKTVEGVLAGLVGAVSFSVLVPYAAQYVVRNVVSLSGCAVALPPLWQFAVMGFFAGIVAQMGDLAASVVKRYCGVKDFSSLIPGHGGIMDRMDSILFTATVVYTFYRIIL